MKNLPRTNDVEIGTSEWYLQSFRLCYRAHQNDWHMYLLSVKWQSDESTLAFWRQSAVFWRQEARQWATWYRETRVREQAENDEANQKEYDYTTDRGTPWFLYKGFGGTL